MNKGARNAMTNKQKKLSGNITQCLFVHKGQVILEFTFCMIVIMIMIFGITKAFFWTGADLAERRISHDKRMLVYVNPNPDEGFVFEDHYYLLLVYNPFQTLSIGEGIAMTQINPFYHRPIEMNAIWDGY